MFGIRTPSTYALNIVSRANVYSPATSVTRVGSKENEHCRDLDRVPGPSSHYLGLRGPTQDCGSGQGVNAHQRFPLFYFLSSPINFRYPYLGSTTIGSVIRRYCSVPYASCPDTLLRPHRPFTAKLLRCARTCLPNRAIAQP